MVDYFSLVNGSDPFQLEQKLYNRVRQPKESAIDYVHAVLKLCARVNKHMDEYTRLKHLTKGLSAAAKARMDAKTPQKVEDFLETSIKFDQWQMESSAQQRLSVDNRTASTLSPYHQNSAWTYGSKQIQPSTTSMSHHEDRSVRHNGKFPNRGCWTCGGLDHYQYECSKNY